jgi:hypothetical protein
MRWRNINATTKPASINIGAILSQILLITFSSKEDMVKKCTAIAKHSETQLENYLVCGNQLSKMSDLNFTVPI